MLTRTLPSGKDTCERSSDKETGFNQYLQLRARVYRWQSATFNLHSNHLCSHGKHPLRQGTSVCLCRAFNGLHPTWTIFHKQFVLRTCLFDCLETVDTSNHDGDRLVCVTGLPVHCRPAFVAEIAGHRMTAFNVLRVGFQLSAQDFEAFNNWDEQIVCVGTAAEFPTVNTMAPHLIDYTCCVS